MKKIIVVMMLFLLVGCADLMVREQTQKNLDAVLADMKASGFIYVGDDNRVFAMKSVLLNPFTTKEVLKNKIFKSNLKWIKKNQSLGHFKIKYIDQENKKIYGIGAITIASNKALLFDVQVFCDALAGVKFHNWQVVGIPPANFKRNFEEEDHGDYPENWDAIKPVFNSYFYSYWSEVIEPVSPIINKG